ncbi:unnamed protein product [Alopecurus aequalis]
MGSCEDVDYAEVFSVPNPAAAPARVLGFSLHQPHLRFPPSYGFHSLPAAAGYLPSPRQSLALGGTPSPASTTTTELESPEDVSADDAVLAYINQFLLEDDDDDESCGAGFTAAAATPAQDSALRAVEKPFVDIIAHAKPAAAQVNSFWADPFAETGGGLSDVTVSSRQSSCQLVPCEPVKEEGQCAVHRGRKKNRQHDDGGGLELEDERRRKQSAVCEEETVREMFDNVLLCNCPNCELQSPLPDEAELSKVYVKGSGNRRGRKKGKTGVIAEEESVDLTTLLIHCAQATAIDDHRSSAELLKQIRRHSSAHGDAGQRLAHYIANGLEARLAGTGSTVHRSLVAHRTSTSDILKILRLYGTACPFLRLSRFFSNQSILNASKGAASLHIIDYGIEWGFQWPVFLQRIAKLMPGDRPRIRITAIDLPQPGFRPTERLEAAGRRLHEYARMFKIPFEYHPIAAKWDTVRIEDLRIDKDDFLIVNCLFSMRHMMDETVTEESPRMTVLNTIRKMNPHLFIHSVVNGTHNAPFFVTRFKEALFYYSSLFDMLETTVSRMDEHRLLLERDFFGREALNVIACEGTERVERPETYK